MELGVERVARLGEQQVDEGLELSGLGDPPMRHAGLSPTTTARPLSIQASVPPATLIPTTPCAASASQAAHAARPAAADDVQRALATELVDALDHLPNGTSTAPGT